MIAANQLTGSVNMQDQSGNTIASLDDMKTTGFAGLAGVGIRLVGDDKSVFALGVFGGPAFIYFSNSFTVVNNGVGVSNYSSNPSFYGPLLGAQFKIRLGNFIINPFGIYFDDVSASCKSFQTDACTARSSCSNLCRSASDFLFLWAQCRAWFSAIDRLHSFEK